MNAAQTAAKRQLDPVVDCWAVVGWCRLMSGGSCVGTLKTSKDFGRPDRHYGVKMQRDGSFLNERAPILGFALTSGVSWEAQRVTECNGVFQHRPFYYSFLRKSHSPIFDVLIDATLDSTATAPNSTSSYEPIHLLTTIELQVLALSSSRSNEIAVLRCTHAVFLSPRPGSRWQIHLFHREPG